jgi:fructokinase
LHLGAALTDGNIIKLYRQLIIDGKKQNKLISFDPNFRKALWASNEKTNFINLCHEFIANADILKVSEEEAVIITGKIDLNDSTKKLHAIGAKMVLITLGSKGTLLSFDGHVEIIDSVNINSIDSTAAGDAFIGAILFKISTYGQLPIKVEHAVDMVRFANMVGAITCTRIGAIQALPYLHEVNKISNNQIISA